MGASHSAITPVLTPEQVLDGVKATTAPGAHPHIQAWSKPLDAWTIRAEFTIHPDAFVPVRDGVFAFDVKRALSARGGCDVVHSIVPAEEVQQGDAALAVDMWGAHTTIYLHPDEVNFVLGTEPLVRRLRLLWFGPPPPPMRMTVYKLTDPVHRKLTQSEAVVKYPCAKTFGAWHYLALGIGQLTEHASPCCVEMARLDRPVA
jgi:hypothetical protein